MGSLGIVFEGGSVHRYTKPESGRQYESVTRILADCGCSGDLQWFRAEHRTRGSRVHHLCGTIAQLEHPSSAYEWDETCEFPDITPYGFPFQRWCRDVGFEVEFAEVPVWNDELEIAGTPDLIGIMRKRGGRRALVDIKSGRVPPSVGLQTAIYKYMAEKCHGVKIDERYSLLLRPDTEYKFRECCEARDLAVFQAMYSGWTWRRANGLLPKEE